MNWTRFAAAITFGSVVLAGANHTPLSIDAQHYKETVRVLAAPEMKGRGTGSPELEKAAKYLAGELKKLGVAPADGKSYFQWFDVTTGARLGKGNLLSVRDGSGKTELKLESQFVPFNFSANGKSEGDLVFAGYGITAPEYNYDDYAGLDVKDKVVVLLRHEPQENDEKAVFNGKVYTRHAQLENKAVNAKFHGARAVLFVNDVVNHPGDGDTVQKFSGQVGPGFRGIPFIQVRAEVVDGWLQKSGKSLKDLVAEIDKDMKPRSFPITGLQAEMNVDVYREVKRVPNVVGYLPGESNEYVILGAHYDHLGLGEQFSMAPSEVGKVHHGADDNASGTAGVLELARYYATRPKPKRGLMFLFFSGEELGLLGSGYYVGNPVLPLDRAVAMINMDMIGRIRDGKVFVGGTGTGSTLKALIEEVKPKYKLNLDLSEQGGYGSSDHTSFTTKQMPVLFFFSGLHADYHKPSDTWDKIEGENAAELLRLVAEVTDRLSAAERPQFVRVVDPRPQGMAGTGGGGSGYGAYFGSIPDMSEVPGGFRISDVRPNSPADKAGLKGGDIIFEFDGKPINNLYDFTYALRARKPGDTVVVKAKRGSEILDTKATLEVRK